MFYLIVMHSVKLICNLFVIIMENCFGITDRHYEVHAAIIDDQFINEDMSYLNIAAREDLEAVRDRRFKTMIIPKQNALAATLEAQSEDKPQDEPVEHLLERAVSNPHDPDHMLHFEVDHKIESSLRDGMRIEYFTIQLFIGERKILTLKKSIEDIRQFDRDVRRLINYDIPNLAEISRIIFN